MSNDLADLMRALEAQHNWLGPKAETAEQLAARSKRAADMIASVAAVPVDRTALCTTSGKSPAEVRAAQTESVGQHAAGYVVLCDEERARGFVRPVRRTYKHTTCGSVTTMAQSIAETYARDPGFYGATFCITCNQHLPVGEFTWADDGTVVGS